MIFLIEYDRAQGRLVQSRSFSNSQRGEAEDVRLNLELALNGTDTVHEVVLLEAEDEAALRRTHQRYFETLAGILASSELVASLTAESLK